MKLNLVNFIIMISKQLFKQFSQTLYIYNADLKKKKSNRRIEKLSEIEILSKNLEDNILSKI